MSRLYLFHQKRIRCVLNALIFIGIVIIFRFFYIQILKADEYKDQIFNKLEYIKKIKGERGKIYDRNGIVLADNITKVTFWVNTNKDINKESIASFFYQYFNKDSSLTISLLKRKKNKLSTYNERCYN